MFSRALHNSNAYPTAQQAHCGLVQAVRREVLELAASVVADITLVSSQLWPTGRGGSCDLMIVVIASAVEDTIGVNTVGCFVRVVGFDLP